MPTHRPPIALHAAPGTAIEIALEAVPGAGVLWHAPPAPAECRLVDGARRPLGPGVGGPVQQCFEFTATKSGRYSLEFELRRPWEREVRALQSVTVEVR